MQARAPIPSSARRGTEAARRAGARGFPSAALGLLLLAAGAGPLGCAHARPEAAGARSGAPALKTEFTDDDLVGLLAALGYEPNVVGRGSITFELERARVVLFNQWGGDLQLYYVVTGGVWGADVVNEWNRTRRLCRAYLDKDGDLVLEADLLAVAGLTERQVASFVSVFERALDLFIDEVASAGADGPPEPAEPDEESSGVWR